MKTFKEFVETNEHLSENVFDNIKQAAQVFRYMTGIDKMPRKPPAGPVSLKNVYRGSSPQSSKPQPYNMGSGSPKSKPSTPAAKPSQGMSLPTRSPHVAAAAAGLQSYNTGDATLKAAMKRGDYKPQQGPRNPDQGLTKAGSFDKAFARARKSGEKEFTWNQKRYTTKLKGE
jgi:hypothetical protein